MAPEVSIMENVISKDGLLAELISQQHGLVGILADGKSLLYSAI